MLGSHPARGAWIEMMLIIAFGGTEAGRTPHGVRGLKSLYDYIITRLCRCRTPHGVRGLKSDGSMRGSMPLSSHPARGAWIEIALLY